VKARATETVGKGDLPMSRLRELYAEKAAPAWSCLVATLNDPILIAVVLVFVIGLFVAAGRHRWNEWYVATHPDGIERSGQFVVGSREDAELQARSAINAWLRSHRAHC
jgi:hypothetical protein